MLVWSRSGRFVVWLVAGLLIGVIYVAPLAVILAGEPGRAMERRAAERLHPRALRRRAARGDFGRAVLREPRHRARRQPARARLRHLGGAGVARLQGERCSRVLGLLFFIPSAVPSVSVGPRPAGRVQPAAAAAQRHDRDRA